MSDKVRVKTALEGAVSPAMLLPMNAHRYIGTGTIYGHLLNKLIITIDGVWCLFCTCRLFRAHCLRQSVRSLS